MNSLKNNKGSSLLFVMLMMGFLSLTVIAFHNSSISYANRSYTDQIDKQAYLSARSVVDAIYEELITALTETDPTANSEVGNLIKAMTSPLDEAYSNSSGVVDMSAWKDASFTINIGTVSFNNAPDGYNFGDVDVKIEKVADSFEYTLSATANVAGYEETVKANIGFQYMASLIPGGGSSNDVFYMDYGFGDQVSALGSTSITDINFSYMSDILVFDSPIIFNGDMTVSSPLQSTSDIILWNTEFNTGTTAILANPGSITALGNIYVGYVTASSSTDKIHAGKDMILQSVSQIDANIYVDGDLYIYDTVKLNANSGETVKVGGTLYVDGTLNLTGSVDLHANAIVVGSSGQITGSSSRVFTNDSGGYDFSGSDTPTLATGTPENPPSTASVRSRPASTTYTVTETITNPASVGTFTDNAVYDISGTGAMTLNLPTNATTTSGYRLVSYPLGGGTVYNIDGDKITIPTLPAGVSSGVWFAQLGTYAITSDTELYTATGEKISSMHGGTSDFLYWVPDGTYTVVIKEDQDVTVTNGWAQSVNFILEGNATLRLPAGEFHVYGESRIASLDTWIDSYMATAFSTLRSSGVSQTWLVDKKLSYHNVVDGYYDELPKVVTSEERIQGTIAVPIIYSTNSDIILQIANPSESGDGDAYEAVLTTGSNFEINSYSK